MDYLMFIQGQHPQCCVFLPPGEEAFTEKTTSLYEPDRVVGRTNNRKATPEHQAGTYAYPHSL